MNSKILTAVLLFSLLFSCSKKESNDSEDVTFTLNGTVYVEQIPAGDVLVEFGIKATIFRPDWNTTTRYTAQDGKYTFTQTTGSQGSYGAMYRVRVMNPLTDYWTEYREKAAPLGQTVTEDFYIISEE